MSERFKPASPEELARRVAVSDEAVKATELKSTKTKAASRKKPSKKKDG